MMFERKLFLVALDDELVYDRVFKEGYDRRVLDREDRLLAALTVKVLLELSGERKGRCEVLY